MGGAVWGWDGAVWKWGGGFLEMGWRLFGNGVGVV